MISRSTASSDDASDTWLSADLGSTASSEIERRARTRKAAQAVAREIDRWASGIGQAMSPVHTMCIANFDLAVSQVARQQVTSPTIKALERLRTFASWKENWDAEGAPAPSIESIDTASVLLGYLKNFSITPTAMLDAFGKPMLLFVYDGGEGEINVSSKQMFDFMFTSDTGEYYVDVDVLFEAPDLPESLEKTLNKLSVA